ncbi:DUF6156 family protein [Candidatus Methylobacter oryzae]|uniref:YD repeat-containing protein n=1 Tax=Candidatus Methylobacter oryzae TaxID=2497749 RepID=A0ABY3CAJ5_9GAMM|nr:DUF6156 family protein [Candidatus Methylobacter oryzae]TRW91500.1 hypothetical protein EKO24_016425 [Candidatus Methylobacter oryzae]
MNQEQQSEFRYFVSYSGVKLPLKLVNEITGESLNNRNTYYRSQFDARDRIVLCQKVVYGEVESEHRYQYYDDGALKSVRITEDDEMREIHFNELGETV